MPRQNRVTQVGDSVAVTARGTGARRMRGTRGCLHELKARRRAAMSRAKHSELLFLDEAIALAVGYRLCSEYRWERGVQGVRAVLGGGDRELPVGLMVECGRSRQDLRRVR